MSNRSFVRAVRKRTQPDLPPIVFELTTGEPLLDEAGEEVVDEEGVPQLDPETVRSDRMTAQAPTPEQLALLLAMGADESASMAEEMRAILDMFRAILSTSDYRILIRRLRDPKDEVDIEMLADITQYLVEEWQDFPTQPPADSSPSQATTGKKSTGRAPGKGSTRSTSE